MKIDRLKAHKLNTTIFENLNKREFENLKRDISERGLQDSIQIKSNGTIICGHLRWRACKELEWEEIPDNMIKVRKDIETDENKVIEQLILDNVLRRQLNEIQIGEAVKLLKPIEKKKAKERHGMRTDIPSTLTESLEFGEADEIIAKKFGRSRNTVKKAEIASEVATKEEKEQTKKTGKIPVSVKKKVKNELQRRGREAQKKANKKRKEKYKPIKNLIVNYQSSERMNEIDNSIQLIITSPPYWKIKEYGKGESKWEYFDYLNSMKKVWKECFRVLQEGCRLCINIGDQYVGSKSGFQHQTIPIHADFIKQCKEMGFMYMGTIIWHKIGTSTPSGGGKFMGSYPYPRDGMPSFEYEYILLFKKSGKNNRKPTKEEKELSKLSIDEWSEYFRGHWNFTGAKQELHPAVFPEELPKRLIRMFSFVGDVVLDPFLGSGTTLKVARELERKGIGYEINKEYKSIIMEKIK